jgi:cell division protein FtsW (lipid II flippase)
VLAGVFGSQRVFFQRWIESESGVIENGTVVALIPAAVLMLIAAYRLRSRVDVRATIWCLLIAALCFLFAGEEVSWGQHWFGWESPEYFVDKNRQGETNLHNLNIHLGRAVKTFITIGIIIGGIVVPLRRRRYDRDSLRYWIYPTSVCVPVAIFVLGVRLIERLKTWFDLDWVLLAVNLKENQEFYIGLFFLIYAWSLAARSRRPALVDSEN